MHIKHEKTNEHSLYMQESPFRHVFYVFFYPQPSCWHTDYYVHVDERVCLRLFRTEKCFSEVDSVFFVSFIVYFTISIKRFRLTEKNFMYIANIERGKRPVNIQNEIKKRNSNIFRIKIARIMCVVYWKFLHKLLFLLWSTKKNRV